MLRSFNDFILKIDGTGFPYLVYGNSDEVKLGQWVLAIGYPLTLETTVTAGIVSAKGRSIIYINKSSYSRKVNIIFDLLSFLSSFIIVGLWFYCLKFHSK